MTGRNTRSHPRTGTCVRLGVQVLALAYRSGEAWNEAGFANKEFDDTLTQALSIADADKRREVMVKTSEPSCRKRA